MIACVWGYQRPKIYPGCGLISRRVSVWFTLVRIHKRVHVGIYLVQISVLIPSFVGKFSFHELVKCWIVIGVKGGFDGTL